MRAPLPETAEAHQVAAVEVETPDCGQLRDGRRERDDLSPLFGGEFGKRCEDLAPVGLALAGIAASIGSVGDAYDDALAELTIGLSKTEAVGRHGPFKTVAQLEYALMEWVDWYNNARLHSRLDSLTPAEYEAAYYARPRPRPTGDGREPKPVSNPKRLTLL
jgi:hypothetical protein